MTASQNSAASPSFSSTCDFQQEIRFAVVMYGGVSLAIYINGIAQELLRMVRATAPDPDRPDQLLIPEPKGTEVVYRRIAQLLGRDKPTGTDWKTVLDGLGDEPVRTRLVVDILSGTSAGGINGIFLAKALANGQLLDQLKQLWVTEGDIELLINDHRSVQEVPGLTAQKPPQALLNGQRMYRKLLAALQGMAADSGSRTPGHPLVDQLDLFVTTTDIRGLPLPLQLADGVAWERRHKNVFQFRYDRSDGIDDFQPAQDGLLAFAARCTSSFPFAFEPFEMDDLKTLLPGGLPDATAADWKKRFFPAYRQPPGASYPHHAYDAAARAFGDGGYLDNKPFSYAIDTLSKRSSELPVDRKLVYIEPSPDHPEDQPVRPGRPNVLENVTTALSLARYETIREELQRILARNRLIERVESYISHLEVNFDWSKESLSPKENFSASDLQKRIRKLGPSYDSYHHLKVSAVTDDIAAWITRASGFDLLSDQFLAIRYLSRAWREDHFAPVVLRRRDAEPATGASPTLTENEFLLFYDLGYRIRRLRFVLTRIDLIYPLDQRAARILRDRRAPSPHQAEDVHAFREALAALRKDLSQILRRFRSLEESLETIGPDHPFFQDLQPLGIGSEHLLSILEGTGDGDRAQERARSLCRDRMAVFEQFAAKLAAWLRARTEPASKGCRDALQIPTGVSQAVRLAHELIQHYYEEFEVYDLLSFPILYAAEVGDELSSVDVFRFSPEDAVSIIDERRTGKRKLAGTALAHFGAFLDRGFRRNDILWGRLDGAERLITVLLPGDEYQAARQALLEQAHLSILTEELGSLDQSQLGEIVSRAWLANDSPEKNEAAWRSLAERQLGAKGNLGLQAALRQVLAGVDAGKLLLFYKQEFTCPKEVNSRLAVESLARSTQIVGAILEDLADRYKKDRRPGAWIARLGGWFWGFVEVAVPRSVPNLLFRHWLKLVYLAEALLILGGMALGQKEVQRLGWTALAFTLLVNLLVAVLADLISGRGRRLKVVVTVAGLIVLFLAGVGWDHLPEDVAGWRAQLSSWIGKGVGLFRS